MRIKLSIRGRLEMRKNDMGPPGDEKKIVSGGLKMRKKGDLWPPADDISRISDRL